MRFFFDPIDSRYYITGGGGVAAKSIAGGDGGGLGDVAGGIHGKQ